MRIETARLWSGVTSACCVILFAGLAAAVTLNTALPFDRAVRSEVHVSASNFLTTLALGLSLCGSLGVLITLSAAALSIFVLKRERQSAIALAAAMGGAIILNNGLKLAFHRVRPEPFFGVAPESFSFPSGHVLFASCFYGVLSFIFVSSLPNATSRAATWTSVALLVSAIGWSRVYLGVHYPTDVVGGLLVAIFWLGALRATGLVGTDSGTSCV
jgi:undecaprenyl-diphosphatase